MKLQNFPTLWAVMTFVYGLAFGSFLNVCIYRLPLGKSIVRPGSACPKCGKFIRAYDNIPVLSWFLLRGRCRNCKQPISARYWIVELLTGFLFLASYLSFGGLTWATLKACVFCFLILGLILTDADHKILPDELTLSGILLGLGFSQLVTVDGPTEFVLMMWRVPFSRLAHSPRLVSLSDAALGGLMGAFFIFAVGELYFRLRGVEGMGFGDVKLMGMIGAFLGLKLALLTIFAGSMLGSIYGLALILVVWLKRIRRLKKRRPGQPVLARAWASATLVYRFHQIPFGVFLGAMGLLGLFFGESITSHYMAFFR